MLMKFLFSRKASTRLPAPPAPGTEALTKQSVSPALSNILENTRKEYFKTLYIVKVRDQSGLGVFVY